MFRAKGERAVAQHDGILADIKTKAALGQVTGEGQAIELCLERCPLGVDQGDLEGVHVTVDLDLCRLFGVEVVHVQAGEGDAGGAVLVLQGQQLQVARDRTVETDVGDAFDRRNVLGGGEPFFGGRVLLKGQVTGSQHWPPLQGDQARDRQRTVFDTVDKQQFAVFELFTEHRAFSLETEVAGAAEPAAIQGDHLQGHTAIDTGQGAFHLLVGVFDRGFQHPFQLAAGVPGTAGTDHADGGNKTQEYNG